MTVTIDFELAVSCEECGHPMDAEFTRGGLKVTPCDVCIEGMVEQKIDEDKAALRARLVRQFKNILEEVD